MKPAFCCITYRFSPKVLAPSPALLFELLPSRLAVISSSVKMSSCASSFSVDNKPEIMASSNVTFNAIMQTNIFSQFYAAPRL